MKHPQGLLPFLRTELAPAPGRLNVTLRCMMASAVVIAISMTFEVPYLVVALFIVFTLTQANVVLTRLIGIMFVLGSTVAIGILILILKFTFDDPLARIVAASAVFCVAVYLSRATRIGLVFFTVAIVVIYGQTIVDLTPDAEWVVRQMLWLWVSANESVAVALVINTLFLPLEPVAQLRDEMRRQLRLAGDMVAARAGLGPAPASGPEPRQAAVALLKLSRFSAMRDRDYRKHEGWHVVRVAAVSMLYRRARELMEASALPISEAALVGLRREYGRLEVAVADGSPFTRDAHADDTRIDSGEGALVEDIHHSFRALAEHDSSPMPPGAPEPAKQGLFLPDAFSNPVYVQFSLKTLMAVLLAYVFYTGVQWPGIHTVLLTCLIVAQPSLGATTRRSLLRIVGAVIGSLLALFMVVFVVQRLDDIVGLLCMSLPVFALAAWIAAGSERVSYAGTQIMFTFSMALLTHFVPTTDLTEIRDRIIGIALGVAISLLIHAGLAPETEGEVLRMKLAGLMRSLGALLRFPVGRTPQDRLSFSQQQMGVFVEYEECEALLGRVTLEPDWEAGNADQEDLTLHTQTVLSRAREILRILHAFKADCAARIDQSAPAVREAAAAMEMAIAAELDRYADCLANHPAETRTPAGVSLDLLSLACRRAEASGLGSPGIYAEMLVHADALAHEVAGLPWGAAARPGEAGLMPVPAA